MSSQRVYLFLTDECIGKPQKLCWLDFTIDNPAKRAELWSVKFARTAKGRRRRDERCGGGLAGNGGCHGCPSSERHVGNWESIQMLGRYVTVLRKRTRQCKAPNGVLDNTEFTSRLRAVNAFALSNLELDARIV